LKNFCNLPSGRAAKEALHAEKALNSEKTLHWASAAALNYGFR
jgi:hypothetical protein